MYLHRKTKFRKKKTKNYNFRFLIKKFSAVISATALNSKEITEQCTSITKPIDFKKLDTLLQKHTL